MDIPGHNSYDSTKKPALSPPGSMELSTSIKKLEAQVHGIYTRFVWVQVFSSSSTMCIIKEKRLMLFVWTAFMQVHYFPVSDKLHTFSRTSNTL